MEKAYLRACASGKVSKINSLIKKVNPNCLDAHGRNALQLACQEPKADTKRIIEFLVQGGVDVDHVAHNNSSVLTQVLHWDRFNLEITSYLFDNSKYGIDRQDPDGLSYLYSAKTVEAAKFLVDRGIDVNSVDKDGNTFLQWSLPTDPIHMYIKSL